MRHASRTLEAGLWKLATGRSKITRVNNYENLEVYTRAHRLFPKIYRMVRTWNVVDQRELGSQIIRAANSVHANIAEGYNKTPADFKRYINNAIGSCDELTSHLRDAGNIGLIEREMEKFFVREYIIVGKQLTRLKQNWK